METEMEGMVCTCEQDQCVLKSVSLPPGTEDYAGTRSADNCCDEEYTRLLMIWELLVSSSLLPHGLPPMCCSSSKELKSPFVLGTLCNCGIRRELLVHTPTFSTAMTRLVRKNNIILVQMLACRSFTIDVRSGSSQFITAKTHVSHVRH